MLPEEGWKAGAEGGTVSMWAQHPFDRSRSVKTTFFYCSSHGTPKHKTRNRKEVIFQKRNLKTEGTIKDVHHSTRQVLEALRSQSSLRE